MNTNIKKVIKSSKWITLDKLFKEFSPEEQAEINDRVRYLQVSMAIKRIRKTLKLTQQDLAAKMRVNRELISRAESGQQNITLETLYRIADATDKKVSISFT